VRQVQLHQHDRGAAAVEFAIVSVLLLTLLFGIIQYGYYFFQLNATTAAAREAGRLAAVGVEDCPSYLSEAKARASGLNSADLTIRLTFQGATPTVGNLATVVADYKPQKFGFPFIPLPSGDISQTAKIRVEQVAPDGPSSC